ncbi:MAG: glycoside hydrolase family 3 N-terminal domain-containing protein [bacterium]|nr:glycoside hydrolase family 3 N-terminal domain-containing protein [bacterium]
MRIFRILFWFVSAAIVCIVFSYGSTVSWNASMVTPSQTVVQTPDEKMLEEIEKLPLEKRVGQLMIFGFATTTPDEHIKGLIKDYGVGGVNLLKRNVVNAEQVKSLITTLQSLTEAEGFPPMFVGVDQEGEVDRFTFLDEHTSQKDITGPTNAYEVAKKRGKELTSLGVTMNFSPVLDYVPDQKAYLYKRTFATSTETAAALGVAMVQGYEAGGVIPVFKHFPGYGKITVDPHKKQATLPQDMSLEKSLSVFKSVLASTPDVPIMTAHIIYPEVDVRPATLSKKFLTEMLRDLWGYSGVIITDDLEMVSVGGEDFREVAVESLEAGADMLISTYTTSRHELIIKAIIAAVESGRLTERQINASVLRVWKLKGKIN